MKRISILLAMLLVGVQAQAQNSFGADCKEITYIGRTQKTKGTVRADWSGSLAIVRFQGRFLEMEDANSGVTWLTIWPQRERWS